MSDREQRFLGLLGAGMVPSGYAEKTMASLMQLHSELMEEKERRVDLYRRLSEKEQTIAELRGQLRLLEEKIASLGGDSPAKAAPISVSRAMSPRPSSTEVPLPRTEGWKQW